jgi:hypothetical protein
MQYQLMQLADELAKIIGEIKGPMSPLQ